MASDSERCLLTATPACRSRAGITRISEGYVAILSNRVGVVCQDCRDALRTAISPEGSFKR